MNVSLNWAQYYSNVDLKSIGPDALVRKIGAQLGAVEEVVEWGSRYEGIIVAKVLSCDKHPNADRLSVCLIDDGGAVKDVERTVDGHVQVVCGAPNVKAGLTVAWIPPGAVVPSTIGKDPLTLEARDIRGKVSNGMLASAAELGISDDHSGIVELSLDELAEGTAVGTTLTKALWLEGEVVIDCENKMFTHRPDCFGILGVARELAGIQHQAFKSPEWYVKKPEFASPNELPLDVEVEAPELVPRFMAVVLKDVVVGPSPLHIQSDLKRVGIKPVNNIVDLTNYLMYLTGQPMHAYDYDKVKAKSGSKPTIIARKARKGDKVALLNGKTVSLDDPAIVIATDKEAIGVGGVMGGAETEVDDTTQTIILEVATFDMYNIRRTAMKYGLFTDAVTRFTKGQTPLQNDRILAYAIENLEGKDWAKQASRVSDVHVPLERPKPVSADVDMVNARLGLELEAKDMAELLQNVEFEVQVGSSLIVTPPFWRTDIEIAEDVIEEIGRLHGFDQIPVTLPQRTIVPAPRDAGLMLKNRVREILSGAGANETLTYSFVHGNLLKLAGQNSEDAYQLTNALSPDLQYYRLSLTPSLLDKVYSNIRSGVAEFGAYEINKVHTKQITSEDNLPVELEHLCFVFSAEDKYAKQHYSGAPYYQAMKYLRYVLRRTGSEAALKLVPLNIAPKEHPYDAQLLAPFHPDRSAAIIDDQNWLWGVVGEYRADVRKALKLPAFTAGFEINLGFFTKYATGSDYQPLPKFPYSVQDISLRSKSTASYAELAAGIKSVLDQGKQAHGWNWVVSPLDIYQPDEADNKTFSFRIRLNHPERTLTTEEFNAVLDEIAKSAHQLGAERV